MIVELKERPSDGMVKEVFCECCGSSGWNFWLIKEGDEYVRCSACGLGRISSIPPAEILFNLYENFSKEYYLGEQKRKIDKLIDHTERLGVRLLQKYYRYIVRGHLYYFLHQSIQRVLSRTGFSGLKIQSKGFDFFPLFEDLKKRLPSEIVTSEAVVRESNFVRSTKNHWYYKPLKYVHAFFYKD